MSERTEQIRRLVSTAATLEEAWRRNPAGHDEPRMRLPWMPFPWPDFIALTAEALPDSHGSRFLDVGCGIGTKMMLAETVFGLEAEGVERVPEYCKAARERGLAVYEEDALGWDGYGGYDLVFFNRPFADQPAQAQLEAQVWQGMRPGAVVIAVNLLEKPPAAWYPILDDGEVRRWIAQKP